MQERSGIFPKPAGLWDMLKGYDFQRNVQNSDADFTEEDLCLV